MQPGHPVGDLHIQPGCGCAQWRRGALQRRAGRQVAGRQFRQLLQFRGALRPCQQQFDLPGVVETAVIAPQSLLKFVGFNRQAVAVAGVETAEGMLDVEQRTQRGITERLAVLGAGQVFGLQHLTLS